MIAKLTKFEKLQHIFLQVQKLMNGTADEEFYHVPAMIHSLFGFHELYSDIHSGEDIGIDYEFIKYWIDNVDRDPRIEDIENMYIHTLSNHAIEQMESYSEQFTTTLN